MKFRSTWLQNILNLWPGKKTFGVYRFLPAFVVFGAVLEYAMINWNPGGTNFYKTYKRRRVQQIVEARRKQVEEKIS